MYVCIHTYLYFVMLLYLAYHIMLSRKLPPVGALFNTSRSEPGVIGGGVRGGGGGGGGGPISVGFFGYPRSGAGKTIVAKGACFELDLGFFGRGFPETF